MEFHEQVITDITNMAGDALNGHNPLPVFTKLTMIERAIKELKSEIQDVAIAEVEKYGKEDVVYDGYKLSVASRSIWNYKHDEVWNQINDQRKNREKLMQQASGQGIELIDTETGELVPPAERKFTTYIKMERHNETA